MTGTARPLAVAREALTRRLAELGSASSGRAVPRVGTLGDTDATRPKPDEQSEQRARSTIHLAADAVLIGPWGGDSEGPSGCGNCLGARWQRLRGDAERDALETGIDTTAPFPWPPVTDFHTAAVWNAYEFTVGLGRPSPTLVTRVDLATLRTTTVPLLAEPLCPYCSADGEHGPQAPEIDLSPWPFPPGGGHRLRSPASYQLPVTALANPVCGVLGAGAWTDIISPTTAPVAGRITARSHHGLVEMTWSAKTSTFRGSRDLALLEGLERYASTFRRSLAPPVVDSYDNLGDAALDPRDCGTYAPETYRTEADIDAFDPSRPIRWVPGYSLRDERPVLVPLRMPYYCDGAPEDAFVDECSSGCAIGGCLEEAVLFGLLELIERDAFLLAWYGAAPLTEIDLTSCAGAQIRGLLDRAALGGYDLRVYDTRADIDVPVIAGLAVRRDGGPGLLSFAAGAGLDPAGAVEAAARETLTYIPTLPRRVRERRSELTAMTRDHHLVRRLPDHSDLFGLPEMAQHAANYLEPAATGAFDEIYRDWLGRRPFPDLRSAVQCCLDQVVAAGCDVIVVDQTSPEQQRFGLRTVRVLAPGLLPMDFGWSRQRALRMPRLRTAPPRAAPKRAPLRDEDLRWVPHPFS